MSTSIDDILAVDFGGEVEGDERREDSDDFNPDHGLRVLAVQWDRKSSDKRIQEVDRISEENISLSISFDYNIYVYETQTPKYIWICLDLENPRPWIFCLFYPNQSKSQ